MNRSPLHIGCAAGFSGDRIDGALPVVQSLIQCGGQALVFETLAERTLALAQLARKADPTQGYEPLLADMLSPVLGLCLHHGIRIVGNFGAANPPAAAQRLHRLAAQLALRQPRIAVLGGDQLTSAEQHDYLRNRLGAELDGLDIVSMNVYQGAGEIAQALRSGADIVVAGRVADPSLVVGPALAHFDWPTNDWHHLGAATLAGHLLECGTQVTGGYFAVPGLKDVPGMASLGFPIASLHENGDVLVSKAANTGGMVTERTVKEQLLYEVHDPAAYLTPDVCADLSQARVSQYGPDQVLVSGLTGKPRPDQLKVNVFYSGGWLAEAEISYAGLQAEARARQAAAIVKARLGTLLNLRIDLIGVLSLFNDDKGLALETSPCGAARDVRLRLAAAHPQRDIAERLLRETTALYTCGPAGGGGVRTSLKPRLNSLSTTIPRDLAPAVWSFAEPDHD